MLSNYVDQRISLRSVNYPDRYIRHSNFQGWLHQISSELDKKDATFIVRNDLQGLWHDGFETISLESVNYPDYYLVVVNGLINLVKKEEASEYEIYATFQVTSSLVNESNESLVSFSKHTYSSSEGDTITNDFIRHQGFRIKYHQNDHTDLFKKDASFEIVSPFWTL